MMPACSVAKYFVSLVDEEAGDSISNLKLQKLLYYAQGAHLALHNTPLFPEAIEAWTRGPQSTRKFSCALKRRGMICSSQLVGL
jgi:uncharacterized phage-associated protein